jgi:hypothetical protein
VALPTFAELYCAEHRCASRRFHRQIFWRSLPWHAVLLAPFFLLSKHFEADWQLIARCATATRLEEVTEEIRDFPYDPSNEGWLRKHAKVRISRRKLFDLARSCLTPPEQITQRP